MAEGGKDHNQQYSLLIADDHVLFRDALVQYIRRANSDALIEVTGDLEGVWQRLRDSHHYNLVMLDLRMPGMNGITGFRQMRENYPDIPVALMSGLAETSHVEQVMDLGAVGYFPKTMSGSALLNAIQLVMNGERYLPIDVQGRAIQPSYYDDSGSSSFATGVRGADEAGGVVDCNLTPREIDVLKQLADGVSNKEIATALDLQVVTVKLHMRSICRKLGVDNRTQAALKAHDLGYTNDHDPQT
jgi:DNA-binding NarL/FixJ family response regulator